MRLVESPFYRPLTWQDLNDCDFTENVSTFLSSLTENEISPFSKKLFNFLYDFVVVAVKINNCHRKIESTVCFCLMNLAFYSFITRNKYA
mgnify:CR=1 FL=1